MFSYVLSPNPCFCFQLKELENLGPKKGVISQSVKDVVQSLVDDDLVLKDKIGTSVSVPTCLSINCGMDQDLLDCFRSYVAFHMGFFVTVDASVTQERFLMCGL